MLSRGLLGPFSALGWSGVQPAGQSGAEHWPREGQGVPGRGGAPQLQAVVLKAPPPWLLGGVPRGLCSRGCDVSQPVSGARPRLLFPKRDGGHGSHSPACRLLSNKGKPKARSWGGGQVVIF